MRPAQDQLRWQIPSLFSTQRAGNHDWLKRKLLQPCRYVPAASFARHHELLSILNPGRVPTQCQRALANPVQVPRGKRVRAAFRVHKRPRLLTKPGSAPSSTAPRGSPLTRRRQGRTRKPSCPREVGIRNEDRSSCEQQHPRILAFSTSGNCGLPAKVRKCPHANVFYALSLVYSIS